MYTSISIEQLKCFVAVSEELNFRKAAKNLNMNIQWKGENENEVGIFNNKIVIQIDRKYYRPTEVDSLLGDASKMKEKLGWEPKISFEDLVKEMIENDLKSI